MPIEGALYSSSLSQQQQQKLELFMQARQFAFEELQLPNNKSYQHYVSLDDRFVVWNLVATPEFSLVPKNFCFFIVGCLQYKGFFQQEEALKEAAYWQQHDHDVSVSGVRAYSTLGWLPDPLLSSQLALPEHILISVLFHELAHQKLYVKDDAAFNEAFAEAVAEAGLRLWYQRNGQEEQLDFLESYWKRAESMRQLLRLTRHELEVLYAQPLSDLEMRQSKRAVLANFKYRLRELKSEWGRFSGYDYWLKRSLNNAHFALVGTYQHWLPAFRVLLAESTNLAEFYQASERLASLTFEQRQTHMKRLQHRHE